jgi:hypothetical protein
MQTITERLNKRMNHQISKANSKTCEGIEPSKLAFLTQMTYKIKPIWHMPYIYNLKKPSKEETLNLKP